MDRSNHMRNLKNLNGGVGVTNYEYITNTDELYRNFMESKKDLSYALRKEVKRDRYVMNAEGLKKELYEVINQDMISALNELDSLVAQDVINKANTMANSGTIGNNNSFAKDIGSLLGKALGKGAYTFIDSIVNDDNY